MEDINKMTDFRNLLQVGDIYTYIDELNNETHKAIFSYDTYELPNDFTVIKIERPTCEYVELEKYLLTDEEKEYLKQITKISKRSRYLRLEYDRNTLRFYEDPDNGWILATEDYEFKFDGLKTEKIYSLEELGI